MAEDAIRGYEKKVVGVSDYYPHIGVSAKLDYGLSNRSSLMDFPRCA